VIVIAGVDVSPLGDDDFEIFARTTMLPFGRAVGAHDQGVQIVVQLLCLVGSSAANAFTPAVIGLEHIEKMSAERSGN